MKKSVHQLSIEVGAIVVWQGQELVITAVQSLDKVIARNLTTKKLDVVPIHELSPAVTEDEAESEQPPTEVDISTVSDDDWATARKRLSFIKPMLESPARGDACASQAAAEAGVSRATIYLWYRAYRNSGLLSSLLPVKPAGGRGKRRVSEAVETLMQDLITTRYLTTQRLSPTEVYEDLKTESRNAGLQAPHFNTLLKRIAWRTERDVVTKRHGRRMASAMFDPVEGTVPDAHWPLAMVQVDHTELPIQLVHEASRQTIGRPYITLGIDVYSRVALGMYLTLDPPSAMSAGMCVCHAILPKEDWLRDLQLDIAWPCWGRMDVLHMDNAREFRGEMLKAACSEYDIDLMLRPVKTPNYGGHIERLMGTVSQKLKRLAGTTFDNPKDKGEYDSEKEAVMDLAQLEKWLVCMLAKYHNEIHSELGMTPLQKYQQGLFGTKDQPGRGVPARRLDTEKLRLDFMPIERRTIQDRGVLIDYVYYFDDVLRPWINAKDPMNTKAKRLFPFRRDPRDISQIYFFDPDQQRYHAINYRNLSHPPLSLWEFQQATKAARAENPAPDENLIFSFVARQREIEAQAKLQTRTTRRSDQRRKEHEKARKKKADTLPTVASDKAPSAPPPKIEGYDPTQIRAIPDDEE